MKILKPLMFLFISIGPFLLWSQDSKIVEIRQAGSSTQDEVNFPGANILLRDKTRRVKLFHEGALVESDQSFFYAKRNFFTAQGTVVFTQGDSIRMTCKYMEYDGQTKKAKAWGQVVLSRPDMKLRTDTLYLDRIENRAFYNTPGTIIDEESTLTSRRGIYFMNEKKYRFINDVKIKNPDYKVDATQLDYFTESDLAYFMAHRPSSEKIIPSKASAVFMTPKYNAAILRKTQPSTTMEKSSKRTAFFSKTNENMPQEPTG